MKQLVKQRLELAVGFRERLGEHAGFPTTLMKLESAYQQGRTCMWIWSAMPAPALLPKRSLGEAPEQFGMLGHEFFDGGQKRG